MQLLPVQGAAGQRGESRPTLNLLVSRSGISASAAWGFVAGLAVALLSVLLLDGLSITPAATVFLLQPSTSRESARSGHFNADAVADGTHPSSGARLSLSLPGSLPDGFAALLSGSDARERAVAVAPFLFPQLYACHREAALALARADSLPETLPGDPVSQSLEDRYLYTKLFRALGPSIVGRTYIEIGALDGRTYSNTLALEREFDWRGLLIEGHPANSVLLRGRGGGGERSDRHGGEIRSNAAIFTK